MAKHCKGTRETAEEKNQGLVTDFPLASGAEGELLQYL